MLRIAICDDSQDARLSLHGAVERSLDRQGQQGEIYEFSSRGLLRWMERHAGEIDLVFLDMEMGELDGMETAQRLRRAFESLQLVFVTAYSDRVFEGYSVSALAYIMKPSPCPSSWMRS
ncbi:MAG: LytTR family DNA-binding domain-containing protein [Oscillospiraceae bacterium]